MQPDWPAHTSSTRAQVYPPGNPCTIVTQPLSDPHYRCKSYHPVYNYCQTSACEIRPDLSLDFHPKHRHYDVTASPIRSILIAHRPRIPDDLMAVCARSCFSHKRSALLSYWIEESEHILECRSVSVYSSFWAAACMYFGILNEKTFFLGIKFIR